MTGEELLIAMKNCALVKRALKEDPDPMVAYFLTLRFGLDGRRPRTLEEAYRAVFLEDEEEAPPVAHMVDFENATLERFRRRASGVAS